MKTISFVCAFTVLAACHPFYDEPPDIQHMRESRPMGNAKEFNVTLRYDVGDLEIRKGSDDNLFSFDLDYDQRRYNPRFDFDSSSDRASMRLDMNSHRMGLNRSHRRENDLTLRLSEKIPLDFDITTGVTKSNLDLTGLDTRRIHLRGGVGKTEVTFDKPAEHALTSFDVESGVGELTIRGLGNAHVERLNLKGGVGKTELDFTGDLGNTRNDSTISVGVGQIRLTLPRDADIEIEAEGSFLSNISAPSFERNGRMYNHRGEGSSKIHIRVNSGIGGVKVDLL